MSNDWWFRNTRLAQEFAFNVCLDKKQSTSVWSPAVAESSDEQIGTAPGTSYIWTVDPGEVLFIPVKAEWHGGSSLIPYILAHTTTKWWNHALRIKLRCRAVKNTEKCPDISMTLSAIPKSSTVVIDGAYKYICLVVVDVNGPLDFPFNLTENFIIGPRGNDDFARLAHAWLGRIPNPEPYSVGISRDVTIAFDKMYPYIIGTSDTVKRTFSIVAELTTSFFMGWSIRPRGGESKASDKSIAGPYVFNQRQPMVFMPHMVDICDLDVTERQGIISGFNSWRVSPLGYLQASEVDVGDPVDPMFKDFVVKSYNEYSLSVTNQHQRILNMCGIYKNDRTAEKKIVNIEIIYYHIQAFAMALAGV
jgi:hypothetical protein